MAVQGVLVTGTATATLDVAPVTTPELAARVLLAEAAMLTHAMADLEPSAADLPTRCDPWSVRELLGHLHTTVERLAVALRSPEPDGRGPLVSAASYYRPDDRFSAAVDGERRAVAGEVAARHGSLADQLWAFESLVAEVIPSCLVACPGRVVRTRHGDVMLLSDFTVTRVLEVAVHGIDLADAVGRPRWLTLGAAELVRDLHLAGPATATLGWDEATLVARVTGRDPMTSEEAGALDAAGVRRLTYAPPRSPLCP